MNRNGDDARDRLDALLVDQARRWEDGRPRRAEDYLAEHPDLAEDPDARLDLAYGELRARRRLGEDIDPESLAGRFPDLREDLLRQVEVGCWAEDEGDALAARSEGSLGVALGISCNMFVPPEPAEAPLSAADFILGEALGSGGMGTVFRARQVSLGKPVALKILRGAARESPDAVRRLLAEGKAAARLRHPRIVGVHGIGRFPDGNPFLVMDLIEGPSLADRLRQAPFAPEEAAAIVAGVAEALEHAHGRGVVHRDLKPSNVLLDADGCPVVTDFGLAKRFDDDSPALTRSDQILGTPHFMAPEQADRRWGPVGPRTDVYGLGALLFALLAGRPPFPGDSTIQVLTRVASAEPAPSPRDLRPDVPEWLAAVCLSCLAKDPAHRPHSAAEVAEALRHPAPAVLPPAKEPCRIDDGWSEVFPRASFPDRAAVALRFLVPVLLILFMIAYVAAVWVPKAAPPTARMIEPPKRPSVLVPAPTKIGPIPILPPVAALPPTPAPTVVLPPAPSPIEVSWDVDRERGEQTLSPIEHPSPLIDGDRLRIECRVAPAASATLFWLKSDGSLLRLFPGAGMPSGRVARVEVSEDEIVIGPPAGTEYFILIVTRDPVPGSTVEAWERELNNFRPLGALEGDSVLIDGHPARSRPRGEPHPGIVRALESLPGRLKHGEATVSTLALPHEEAAP